MLLNQNRTGYYRVNECEVQQVEKSLRRWVMGRIVTLRQGSLERQYRVYSYPGQGASVFTPIMLEDISE